jgi:hypothetical protein
MTPRELHCLFREEMNDESKSVAGGYNDAQFSENLVNHYIDEAERQAAENSSLIFDRTSSICTIPVAVDNSLYRFDDRIIRIDRIDFIDEDNARTNLINHSRESAERDLPGWRDEKVSDNLAVFVEDNSVELAGISDRVGSLALEVIRYPMYSATAQGSFEISGRNHSHLMDWVKYLAYNNRDADIYAPDLAMDYRRKFELRFGFMKNADTWRYSQKDEVPRTTYNGI